MLLPVPNSTVRGTKDFEPSGDHAVKNWERNMELFQRVLMLISIAFAVSQAVDRSGLVLSFASPAVAQEAQLRVDRPVEKMSVEEPSWERAAGLLVIDVTVNNGNEYPVRNVIIACDLFDERGAQIGSRGPQSTECSSPARPGSAASSSRRAFAAPKSGVAGYFQRSGS
jgi:hypothetical protein